MRRDWATEEKDHSLRVAAAYDRLMAARAALAPEPFDLGPATVDPEPHQFHEFNTALAAYEDAKDARDAFFDERRRDDPAWIET